MVLQTVRSHVAPPLSAGAQYMLLADLVVVAILLLLPTWIAIMRRHPQTGQIFLINLLLSWTGIGWLLALILALRNQTRAAPEQHVCRNCYMVAAPVVRPCRWFFGSGAWNAARLYDALVPSLSCPHCHAPNPVPLHTPAGRKIAYRSQRF